MILTDNKTKVDLLNNEEIFKTIIKLMREKPERTVTDDRVTFVGKGFVRKPPSGCPPLSAACLYCAELTRGNRC